MGDVVQKIKASQGHDNGRAVVYVSRGGVIYAGGYSGVPEITNISMSALENRLTNRLDENTNNDFEITHSIKNASMTVGTTAVQLQGISGTVKGIQLKASSSNSGQVYLGSGFNVTPGTASGTDGFPIGSSEGFFVPVNEISSVYAIGSVPNCKVFMFAI